MPNPRGSKLDVEALEAHEFAALRVELRPDHWRLLFDVLMFTGVRIAEALVLRRRDFVYGEIGHVAALMIVRLKRREERGAEEVPIPGGLGQELDALTPAQPEAHVFGTAADPLKGLGYRAAHKALRAAAERAGVRVNGAGRSSVHPHLYRHGFGVMAASHRMTNPDGERMSALEHETVVQAMLGHASVANTRRYFRRSGRSVQDSWRAMQDALWAETAAAG